MAQKLLASSRGSGTAARSAGRAARSSGGQYLYLARTASGGPTLGLRRASSPRGLAASLRAQRQVLNQSFRLPDWLSPPAALVPADQAALNEQLSQLLSRGVPLVEALEVAASVVKPGARPIVDRMREAVAAGGAFSDACKQSGAFDRVTIAIYRAAERSGELDRACANVAVSIRRLLQIRSKAQTVLIYPAVLMTIGVVVGLVMLMLVIPMIGTSLLEAQLDLPWYTKVMVTVGLTMQANWPLVLGAIAAIVVGVVIGRDVIGRLVIALLRRIPGVGSLFRVQESARFFSVMAAMTRSGLPLAEALAVAGDTVNDPPLRAQLNDLRTRLIRGGVLRNLLDRLETLPLAVRKLLVAADRSGDLETAFGQLASDLTAKLEQRTGALLGLLEPLIIVLVFLPIGGMILSIMVPLLSLTSQAL